MGCLQSDTTGLSEFTSCGAVGLLNGEASTKGTSVVAVGKLDRANPALTGGSTSAGSSIWDCDCKWEVFVDVGSTLHDASTDHELLPSLGGLADGSAVAGDLSGHGTGDLLGEITFAGGVDVGGQWTGTVGGDDVEGTGDGSALGGDLGERATGENHGFGGSSFDLVVTGGISVTTSLLTVEDGGVRFGLVVFTSSWDDTTLNTVSGAVSTKVTSDNCDFAVGRYERSSDGESHEEDVGVCNHFDGCSGWKERVL